MKNRGVQLWTLLVLLGTGLGANVSAQSLFLSEGESFSFSFSPLPFADVISGGRTLNGGRIIWNLGDDRLMANESVRVDFFETSLTDPPVFTRTVTGSDPGLGQLGAYGGWSVWPDREGAVRITMISGGMEVSRLVVEVVEQDNIIYGRVVPVPEPAAWCVAFAGLATMAAAHQIWKRK